MFTFINIQSPENDSDICEYILINYYHIGSSQHVFIWNYFIFITKKYQIFFFYNFAFGEDAGIFFFFTLKSDRLCLKTFIV